jgi:hypothetical protein
MNLRTNLLPIDEQLRVIELMLRNYRRAAEDGNEIARQNYEALKTVAGGLQARLDNSRSDTLAELERALDQVLRSKVPDGYEEGQMINLAGVVIRRWQTIAQALEAFEGE